MPSLPLWLAAVVKLKTSTKEMSLSQQFWLAEVSCRKSMNIVHHLSTAASLYSGVYAQGCVKIHISSSLPLFFLAGTSFWHTRRPMPRSLSMWQQNLSCAHLS